MNALETFERGVLPRFTPEEFVEVDDELNDRYRQLQTHEFEGCCSVNADSIRTAQRVWLHYREAWVEFGRVKYPSVAADSWRTWLTLERIVMWKDIDQ